MQNFTGIMDAMLAEKAIVEVQDAHGLSQQAARLLSDGDARAILGARAAAHVAKHAGVTGPITEQLQRYLT